MVQRKVVREIPFGVSLTHLPVKSVDASNLEIVRCYVRYCSGNPLITPFYVVDCAGGIFTSGFLYVGEEYNIFDIFFFKYQL